jgi:hypothetical protein
LPGVSARHCDCALAAAFGSDGERIAAMLHDDIAARQDAGARLGEIRLEAGDRAPLSLRIAHGRDA